MPDFNVTTKKINDVYVLNVNGYLDAHTAPDLETVFERLIKEDSFKIVVNFSELNYISSAGLGVFMAYVETMRENGGDIIFSNLNDDVYSIFDLLGFPVLYKFFKSEEEAVKNFE